MPRISTFASLVAIGIFATFGAAPSSAQDYPSKPIRLVVPYPPGSGTDIVGRLLAQRLGEGLGQQVYVDNRPGAGATIGTAFVAKGTPDGYTILMADLGPLAIGPSFYRQLPYDPIKELAPISQVAVLPFVLVVHPSVPAHNVPELIALARAKPGQLTFASSGTGNATHLTFELFKARAGIDIVHVPYKGGGPAMADVVAGHVNCYFGNYNEILPHAGSGRVRVLATSGEKRARQLPDVPTVAEQGFAGFRTETWNGFVAPAGTPRDIVERIAREMQVVLKHPDVVKRWQDIGAEASTMTPAEYGAFVKAELEKWSPVVKASGAKAEQ